MITYYDMIKKLSEKNRNERMPSNGLKEIQQWYSIVLDQPYLEVRIFCKDLNWLNNQFMLDKLHNFLYNRWASVKILLKEDCDLSWFHYPNQNGNLEIRTATGSYSSAEAKEFAVVDDHCFRFEVRPDFGIINFNHYNDSQRLIDAFHQAFHMGLIKNFKKVKENE